VDALLGEVEDVVDRTGGLRVADLIRQPRMNFLLWIADTRQERDLDGVQRALDISRVHAKVNNILGFDKIWQKRHAPCPKCDGKNLGNWIGDEGVLCKDCNHTMTLDDYQAYCVELLKEHHGLRSLTP
jgi:hypothetical protein